MHNIRSYTQQKPITFTPGTILFQGDIGSGKSTILLAIEFALFGLGDLDGRHLLRGNENEGSVRLDFEVNDRDYSVFRSLIRKRRYVRQDEGYIIEDDVRTDYSVTEMKERILKILDFHERPQPNTCSLIFRYAVFTPQEMMKEVLFQRVDRRLDTLRRAFGIEDYSIARTNVDVFRRHLRDNINVIQGQTLDLDTKKHDLETEKKHLNVFNEELAELTDQFNTLDTELQTVRSEIKHLSTKRDAVLKLEANITHLQTHLTTEQQNLNLLTEDINKLRIDQQTAKTAEAALEHLKPQYDEFTRISKQIRDLEVIEVKYQQTTSLIAQLQVAITSAQTNLQTNVEAAETEIARLQTDIDQTKREVQTIVKLQNEANEIQSRIQQIPTLSKQHLQLLQQQSSIKTQITSITAEQETKQREWHSIKTIGVGAQCPRCHQELSSQHYEQVQKEYHNEVIKLSENRTQFEHRLSEVQTEITSLETTIHSLEAESEHLSTLKENIAVLEQTRHILTQKQNDLARKQVEVQQEKDRLDQKQFAVTERTQLEDEQTQLKTLEPHKILLDTLKQQVRAYQETALERHYTEHLQIASRYPTITDELTTKTERHQALTQQIHVDNQQLRAMQTQFQKDKDVLDQLTELETKHDAIEQAWQTVSSQVSGKTVEIQGQREKIDGLTSEIAHKEALLAQRAVYQEYRRWVDDYFSPATEDIERHVMLSIREDFDDLFQRWFSQLMETGDITVRIDDQFTPIIEQNGYELEVTSLSGGEKTSVALAYRLALNVMVKRVCDAMHSNLLMLDEPTDGFSTEQLVRVRDILDELQCDQVIMVSHERELEGFVDRIFRVRKEAGISHVTELQYT
jgi:exonuclease SbcC